jgi:hypothetical protein
MTTEATTIRRDISEVWDQIGGLDRLYEMAEDDFPSFLKFVIQLEPKLAKAEGSLNAISDADIESALQARLEEVGVSGRLGNTTLDPHKPRRPRREIEKMELPDLEAGKPADTMEHRKGLLADPEEFPDIVGVPTHGE